MAPRLLVPDTDKLAAEVIAAFRSRSPVMLIAPSGLVAPKVSAVALPKMTSAVVPSLLPSRLMVNARALTPSESMVPLKVMLLSVVVKVTVAALKVTPLV